MVKMVKITTKIKSNMKKSILLAAIVLISAGCMAQKNPVVKKAKNYMMAETPDVRSSP